MEFFRNPKLNIVGSMKVAFLLSSTLVLASVALLVAHGGPRLGIDFTGGSVLQVRIAPVVEVQDIRTVLANKGYKGAQVTEFGSADEFLITVPAAETQSESLDAAQILMNDLKAGLSGSEIELRREESVGPKIGGELRQAAGNSIVAALVLIVLYITVRFVFRYGIAAIVALVHDVTLTLGVFSLLNMEINLSIIAAFLTIIGYSLNDTIVVFDRVRENMKMRRKEKYRDVINRSINECLSRTVLTSVTTFFVAATLFVMGGAVIHDFAFALSFGVIVGTYSSMFIAAPVLVWWSERRQSNVSDKRRRLGMDM